jgi:ankyrin repeat protein
VLGPLFANMSGNSRSSNGRKSGGPQHANGISIPEGKAGTGPFAPSALNALFVQLVKEDDAEGLETALTTEKERLASGSRKGKSKGSDPSANLKKRILQFAAACDAGDCIAFLLDEEEVPIDGMDENGLTPMHHAAQNHASRAVQALIDRGEEGGEASKDGRTPLETALMSPR